MFHQTINRREMIYTSLKAGFIAGAAPAIAKAQNRELRNVLLIIADDHGLDMPCYGNQAIETPNLERLAEEGTRFTNAFCTTASCSASRSVIFTGLHNHRNGQYGHAHSYNHFYTLQEVQTLPFLLKRAGYTNGIIGKFHVNPAELYPFDVEISGKPIGGNRNGVAMAEKAKEFFQQNQDRPFYLHVGFSDPHRAGKGFGNEHQFPDVKRRVYDPDEVVVPSFLPDQPEVRKELAEYYQAVTRMDQGIGLILDALEETGKDKDTLVIYISDNGIPFPGAKTNVYDPGIHMPMIVRSPHQQKRGGVNNAMVSFTSLVPTILEWTGAEGAPYPFHGKSFLSILDEENPIGWDEVFFSHTFHEITMYYPMRGIRTRKHKLILNLASELPYPFASDLYASATWQGVLRRGDHMYGPRTVEAYLERPAVELYDLENDPDETTNVAGDPAYVNILQELGGKTQYFREITNDPWLILQNYKNPQ